MTTRSGASRWTMQVPDDKSDPRGPQESGRRALGRLGPFKYRLQQAAEDANEYEGLDGRLALSEELAAGRVWHLTKSYNEQSLLEKHAPRSKDVANNLTKLKALADEFSSFLNSMDDITRHRLQTFGSGIKGGRDFLDHPAAELADVDGLPGGNEPLRWVQRLDALSQYADASMKVFLCSKGINPDGPVDKGGNRNLHKDLWGSPSYRLVTDGWALYDLFKPGKATGTEGGHFHLFLMEIFEFATGLEPEVHSRLTYWLKKIVPVQRRYKEVSKAQRDLNRELILLQHGKPPLDRLSRETRMAEIVSELRSLERERCELWGEMYPYSV